MVSPQFCKARLEDIRTIRQLVAQLLDAPKLQQEYPMVACNLQRADQLLEFAADELRK